MNVKKMYATCLMISFFVCEPMQAKDTLEYMEEIFNTGLPQLIINI